MGDLVCDNNCKDCNFKYWKWISEKGILISSGEIKLRDCKKIDSE